MSCQSLRLVSLIAAVTLVVGCSHRVAMKARPEDSGLLLVSSRARVQPPLPETGSLLGDIVLSAVDVATGSVKGKLAGGKVVSVDDGTTIKGVVVGDVLVFPDLIPGTVPTEGDPRHPPPECGGPPVNGYPQYATHTYHYEFPKTAGVTKVQAGRPSYRGFIKVNALEARGLALVLVHNVTTSSSHPQPMLWICRSSTSGAAVEAVSEAVKSSDWKSVLDRHLFELQAKYLP